MGDMVLVINPGSTSTKIAVFSEGKEIFASNIVHTNEELEVFKEINEQYQFRLNQILYELNRKNISLPSLTAVSSRGGLLKPLPQGGTYVVNKKMCDDLLHSKYKHASNLGARIAYELSTKLNIPAYIVDPVIVDEMREIAKISGFSGYERKAFWHALNQKAVARKFACSVNKKYEEVNCIVAHMGGGITVGAHQRGKVVDVNNGLGGDGPFSPERCGSISNEIILQWIYEEGCTQDEVKKRLVGKGGCISYLHTSDGRAIEKLIEKHHTRAELIYEAMAYQVSKQIGAMASVLYGDVDGIILTGGLAYSDRFVNWIRQRVGRFAPIFIYPGEDEMKALYEGAARVLHGEEQGKVYM